MSVDIQVNTIKSIETCVVRGVRVVLRTSLNVPVTSDGEVVDLFRLKRATSTIEWLSRNGARTVVLAHLGRKGESLENVVKALQSLTPNISIKFFNGSLAEAAQRSLTMKDCEVIVLENVRSHDGEESNDNALARDFAGLGDVYVNDAFADAHRTHASVVGVASLLPAYAGLLMMEEVTRLGRALTPPKESLAIVGGAKFETKIPLIRKLLGHYSKVLLCGALANDLFKARGFPFGASLVSDMSVPVEIATEQRIVMPLDVTIGNADVRINTERISNVADVRAEERIVDIGSKTAQAWAQEISRASFVVWNGTTGVYERGFVSGTLALARAVAESGVEAVIGGGDTLAALEEFDFDTKKVFLSTGGGAMLEFLTNGTLVGLEALKR